MSCSDKHGRGRSKCERRTIIIIIIIIISLLKTHVRRTCLHNKNITNETHKYRVILIKNELKIGLR